MSAPGHAANGAARRLAWWPAPMSATAGRDAVFVQPVGATEHHGPHLPAGTDSIIATAVVDRLLERHPALNVTALPTIEYSVSTEHIWAPGTLSLSAGTFAAVLDDVGASIKRTGATRLVLLNTHGGNTPALQIACRELRVKYGLATFLVHPFLPPDRGGAPAHPAEFGLGIHGGFEETSIMLHLRRDLVDMSVAARAVPDWLREFDHVGFSGAVEFGWESRDISPNGVIGDPTLASAADGERLVDAAVDQLARSLTEIGRFEFPPTR